MNTQDIKNFLENEPLIKQLKLDCSKPTRQKCNKDLFNKILLNNNLIKSNNELIYLLKNKNNLENLHIFCSVCGKKNNFINSKTGYLKHCCLECSYKNPERSRKCLETKLNTIDDYGLNIIQKAIKKGRQTNLKRIGVDNPFKSKDPNLNGQATKQKRYGNPYYTNRNKAWETCYKNNGVKCILKLKEVHNKGIKKASSRESREKARITHNKNYGVDYSFQRINYYKNLFIKLWGVDNYSKTKEFKDLWKNEDFILNFTNKIFNTKKKNGTTNTSKSEELLYEKLLKENENKTIYRNYKCDRYPYHCDFYIVEDDLFIELNTH